MSLYPEIRGALQQAFEAVWGAANIAYEGKPFTPQPDTPWAEITVLPASGRPSTLGDDHLVLHEGEMVAVLIYPGNKGTGAAETMADTVKEAFRASVHKDLGTTQVRFRYAERRPALMDAAWTRVPIVIGWYLWDTRY